MYFIDNKTWSLIPKQEMDELEKSVSSYSRLNQSRNITIDRLDGLAMVLILVGILAGITIMALTGQWVYLAVCFIAIFALFRTTAYLRNRPEVKLTELQLKINSALVEVPEILQSAIGKFYYNYRPADFAADHRNANNEPSPDGVHWTPPGVNGPSWYSVNHGWIEEFPDEFQDLLDTTSNVASQVEKLDGAARARFFDEFCATVRPTLIRIAWLHGQKIVRYDMSAKEAEFQDEIDQNEANRRAKFDNAVLEKNLVIMTQAMNRTTA